MTIFAPQQDAALIAIGKWLKAKPGRAGTPQVFRLFGYAGTGKTTLARHIANNADGSVQFAAYTGKAALVLRNKGCKDASTIHSMIYTSRKAKPFFCSCGFELSDMRKLEKFRVDHHGHFSGKDLIKYLEDRERRGLKFSLREDSPVKDASLVIIDECSMVDEKIGMDLLSFGCPVLVLGDPAQLPPVRGCGFFTEAEPDAMLTEIHRQAEDNPIIRMSIDVREGGFLKPGKYGESRVVTTSEGIEVDEALAADQILVGTNRKRHSRNKRFRKLLGVNDDMPVKDDKLICLRNDHRVGLLNGGFWKVMTSRSDGNTVGMNISSDDSDIKLDIRTLKNCFDGTLEDVPQYEREHYDEFSYGYAITVHKSQGSQWDNVVLFDESDSFRSNSKRWLYTGITRAAKQITVVV